MAGHPATLTDIKTGESTKLGYASGVSSLDCATYAVFLTDFEIDSDHDKTMTGTIEAPVRAF